MHEPNPIAAEPKSPIPPPEEEAPEDWDWDWAGAAWGWDWDWEEEDVSEFPVFLDLVGPEMGAVVLTVDPDPVDEPDPGALLGLGLGMTGGLVDPVEPDPETDPEEPVEPLALAEEEEEDEEEEDEEEDEEEELLSSWSSSSSSFLTHLQSNPPWPGMPSLWFLYPWPARCEGTAELSTRINTYGFFSLAVPWQIHVLPAGVGEGNVHPTGGQAWVLQFSDSVYPAAKGHSVPPFAAGVVIEYVWLRVPVPQVAEHVVQSPKPPTQLTGQGTAGHGSVPAGARTHNPLGEVVNSSWAFPGIPHVATVASHVPGTRTGVSVHGQLGSATDSITGEGVTHASAPVPGVVISHVVVILHVYGSSTIGPPPPSALSFLLGINPPRRGPSAPQTGIHALWVHVWSQGMHGSVLQGWSRRVVVRHVGPVYVTLWVPPPQGAEQRDGVVAVAVLAVHWSHTSVPWIVVHSVPLYVPVIVPWALHVAPASGVKETPLS
jgi:hypothetical protein